MKNRHPILRQIFLSVLTLQLFYLLPLFFATAQQLADVESGVLRIKVSEELAEYFESSQMVRTSSNILITGVQAIDNVNHQFKAYGLKRVFRPGGSFEEKHKRYGLHRWYEVSLDQANSVMDAVAAYGKIGQIDQAEPVYKKTIIGSGRSGYGPLIVNDEAQAAAAALPGTSNDPFLGNQWHYNNTGQSGGTAGADISLLQAWAIETGSPNVVVAVTDGGIQVNHPDLAANMWVNINEIPGNAIDDDNNGYVDDIFGYGFGDNTGTIAPDNHGTHVGGTIAAVTNNGIGVAGVAGGSGAGDGVRLMSLAAFGANDSGGFAETYVYAADMGAVISQNSWGYTNPGVFEQAVLDAIDYFIAEAGRDQLGNQVGPMNGGIVIFAAGNDDSNASYYPGFYDQTLAVSGTTHADTKAWYSNYGTWVDLAAPGGETNTVAQQGVLSTLANNQYGYFQGTSMACPHVSGVAGLIVSRYGGPGFTPALLRDRLLSTSDNIDAVDPPFAGLLGVGRLNANAALQQDDNLPPEAITDLAVAGVGITEISISWTSPLDSGNVQASTYDIRYATFPITETNFESATKALNVPAPLAAGSPEAFTITGLAPATTYYVAIRSADFFGNVSSLSNVVEQATNEPPVISVTPSSLTENLLTAQTSTQPLTISNVGLGPLSFSFLQTNTPGEFASVMPVNGDVPAGGSVDVDVTFNASSLLSGTYHQNLLLLSNDPLNDTLEIALTLQVTNNGAPIVTVDQDTIGFDGVFVGGTMIRHVAIHNAGSDTLSITNAVSDNPDFSSDFTGEIKVAPFADDSITLVFNPSSVGVINGSLSLSTNDPDRPLIVLTLIGEGLEAPGISVSPLSFSKELFTGAASTESLTITNTGGSDLVVSMKVVPAGTTQQVTKVIDIPVSSDASTSSLLEKQTVKTVVAGQQVTLKSAATFAASTSVLLLTPDDNVNDLATILNGFDDIEASIFPKSLLPSISLADVLDYDVIMTTNNTQWLAAGGVSPVAIGDLLADYIDQGGKVIVNQFAYSYDDWKMSGRFIDEQYGPFIPSTTDYQIQVTLGDLLVPGHPVVQGVSSLTYSGFVQNVAAAPGAVALATFSNGDLFLAANQNVVALNMLPSLGNGGGLQWSGDLPAIYANAVHWLGGLSYVKVDPENAVVPSGASVDVNVIFDADGLAGGVYETSIDISTNVPGNQLLQVPAILTVLGPEFTVTPDSLVEELLKNQSSTRTITLTNNGNTDYPFTVSVSGQNVMSEFTSALATPIITRSSSSGRKGSHSSLRTEPTPNVEVDLDGVAAIANEAVGSKSSSSSRTAQTSIALYSTGFENFALGDVNGQEGWSGQFGNWTIEGTSPANGAQHFRGLSDGFGLSLAFSPQVAIGSDPVSTATMKLKVGGTGVTWQIIPQSPTAQLVTTRIQFLPNGTAQALVSDGAGGAVYATIPVAVPSGYFDLTIESVRATAVFDVYFNDTKVFSGQGFAGDIETLVVLSLMEIAGPTLDLDDVQLLDGKREIAPSFITVNPSSGTLGAGQSVAITVAFDATDLEFGTYASDVVVRVADVEEWTVPAILAVVGDPAIEVSPTVLQAVVDFGEDTIKNFEIRNTGGRPLDFSMQVIGAGTETVATPAVESRFSQANDRMKEKDRVDKQQSRKLPERKPASLELLTGTNLLEEHFEGGSFPPAGWSVVDNEGTGVVWGFAGDYGEGNYAGTGEAATVSSDAAGPMEYDTELITPSVAVAGFEDITVQYNVNYQNYLNLDFLDLDIQVDGGSWVTVLSWNEDHGGFFDLPGEPVTVPLDAYLEGATSFRLRWHYYDPQTGDYDWYAQVDDVVILGDPRAWLRVSPASGTVPVGEAISIDAHFDAEDLNPGFLVAGVLVGSNAVQNPLVGVVASIEVREPAVITVSPDTIKQELMRGESAVQQLVISNTGSSALKFSFENLTVQGASESPLERIASGHTRTSKSPNQWVLNDSRALARDHAEVPHAVDLYATGFEEFAPGDINGQLGWSGQWGNWTVESINPFSGAQHFSSLSDGLGSTLAFSPNVGIGTDEISSVTMVVNLESATGVTWQFIPQSPSASLVVTRLQVNQDGSLQALVTDSLGNASFVPVAASLPSGYFELRMDVVRATSVFTVYFDGVPVFTGQGFTGDIEEVALLSLMEVAGPVLDMDNFAILDGPPEQPWLSINPRSGVVPAGSSTTISVVLDASELEKGIYEDVLNLASNDPQQPVVVVPVTLIVDENMPPLLAEVSDTSVLELDVLDITFTATDVDDSLVTVHAVGLPDFVTVTSQGNGFASYHIAPAIGSAGDYVIMVVAEDARGLTDSAAFHLTVLSYGVTDFSLVDIKTGSETNYKDTITLDVSTLDQVKYMIRANTNPSSVGSVLFRLDGKKINVDNASPYVLNPLAQIRLSKGSHTLEAQAYTGKNAKGTRATGHTVVLNVVNSSAVDGFKVVDKKGNILMDLVEGSVVDIKDPAFSYINVMATTNRTVGSVKFELNGRTVQIDHLPPYSLAGDLINFFKWSARPGHYVLKATPYSQPLGLGIAGTSLTVEFDVVSGVAVAARSDQGARLESGEEERSEGERAVTVFPNPASDVVTISLGRALEGDVNVELIDSRGKRVYNSQVNTGKLPELNLSLQEMGLPTGMYYLHIRGNGVYEITKIIKL